MIKPVGEYTAEMIAQRENLAIEMLLTTGLAYHLIEEILHERDATPQVVAYAYAVILAGIDGPSMLVDESLNAIIRRGLTTYPQTLQQAASRAVTRALEEFR